MPLRVLLLLAALCAGAAFAQTPQAPEKDELVPGKRMVRAVQFPYDLKVKFTLFPTGRLEGIAGWAEVRRRKKEIEVEVELEEAPPASQLRPEYRGYVVWALTPAGKFVNLGALGGKGKLETTTNLPSFGFVISAEADLKAASPADPVLESGYPSGKRARVYPIHRVYYAPGVK